VQTDNRCIVWITWYMRQIPRYLQVAVNHKRVQQLLDPLGVEDIATLRTRFALSVTTLLQVWGIGQGGAVYAAQTRFDFNTIGSQ